MAGRNGRSTRRYHRRGAMGSSEVKDWSRYSVVGGGRLCLFHWFCLFCFDSCSFFSFVSCFCFFFLFCVALAQHLSVLRIFQPLYTTSTPPDSPPPDSPPPSSPPDHHSPLHSFSPTPPSPSSSPTPPPPSRYRSRCLGSPFIPFFRRLFPSFIADRQSPVSVSVTDGVCCPPHRALFAELST